MSSKPRDAVARREDSQAWRCAWRMEAIVSVSSRMNDSSGVAGMPISARGRRVIASSNQTFSTKVACFTRPRSVVRDGTQRSACLLLGQPVQAMVGIAAVLVEERLDLGVCWLADDVLGRRAGQEGHVCSIAGASQFLRTGPEPGSSHGMGPATAVDS